MQIIIPGIEFVNQRNDPSIQRPPPVRPSHDAAEAITVVVDDDAMVEVLSVMVRFTESSAIKFLQQWIRRAESPAQFEADMMTKYGKLELFPNIITALTLAPVETKKSDVPKVAGTKSSNGTQPYRSVQAPKRIIDPVLEVAVPEVALLQALNRAGGLATDNFSGDQSFVTWPSTTAQAGGRMSAHEAALVAMQASLISADGQLASMLGQYEEALDAMRAMKTMGPQGRMTMLADDLMLIKSLLQRQLCIDPSTSTSMSTKPAQPSNGKDAKASHHVPKGVTDPPTGSKESNAKATAVTTTVPLSTVVSRSDHVEVTISRIDTKELPHVEKGSLGIRDKNDVYVKLRLGPNGKELTTEPRHDAGATASFDYVNDQKLAETMKWVTTVGELATSKLSWSVWDWNDPNAKDKAPDVCIGSSAEVALALKQIREGGTEMSETITLENQSFNDKDKKKVAGKVTIVLNVKVIKAAVIAPHLSSVVNDASASKSIHPGTTASSSVPFMGSNELARLILRLSAIKAICAVASDSVFKALLVETTTDTNSPLQSLKSSSFTAAASGQKQLPSPQSSVRGGKLRLSFLAQPTMKRPPSPTPAMVTTLNTHTVHRHNLHISY